MHMYLFIPPPPGRLDSPTKGVWDFVQLRAVQLWVSRKLSNHPGSIKLGSKKGQNFFFACGACWGHLFMHFCACRGEKVYLKHVFQEKRGQFFKIFGACGAGNAVSNKGCLEFCPTLRCPSLGVQNFVQTPRLSNRPGGGVQLLLFFQAKAQQKKGKERQ